MISFSSYEEKNKNFNIYFNDNSVISNQNELAQQNNISNIRNMTNLTTLINIQQKIANQFHISLDSQILNETSNDISSNTNSSPSIDQSDLIESEKLKSIESKLKSIGVNNTNKINEIIKRLSLSQSNEFLNELERLVDILSSNDLEKKLHPKVVKAIKESTNGLSSNEGIGIKIKREFETLKDFAIKLLTDLIDALADPNSISQGSKGTCAQTTVERSIAERNPAQYVKIITDLITKGEYIAPNGKRIPLNEGGIKKVSSEIENRYLTTRIITPSFMEFYYDKDPDKNDYDDDNDEEVSSKSKGSSSIETASAIYNTLYIPILINIGIFNNNIKTSILKELLRLSKYPIFLYVNYEKDPNSYKAGHAVELKSITDNSITISNPWGQIETYTNTGKNIEPASYNTEIQNYQDFIKRIGLIVVSQESLLLAIKSLQSNPSLYKLLPQILPYEKEIEIPKV